MSSLDIYYHINPSQRLQLQQSFQSLHLTRQSFSTNETTTLVAIDKKTWEGDASTITEVGISTMLISKTSNQVPRNTHLIIKEHQDIINGKLANSIILIDTKDHFNFGTSQSIDLNDLGTRINDTVSKAENHDKIFLVFYTADGCFKWLTAAGCKVAYLKEKFIDVQAAWQALFFEKYGCFEEKRKMHAILGACGIHFTNLNNAENDACYAMLCLKKISKIPREPHSVSEEQIQANT